jgi:hypothetical protein
VIDELVGAKRIYHPKSIESERKKDERMDRRASE